MMTVNQQGRCILAPPIHSAVPSRSSSFAHHRPRHRTEVRFVRRQQYGMAMLGLSYHDSTSPAAVKQSYRMCLWTCAGGCRAEDE